MEVVFAPNQIGAVTGQVTIDANVPGGRISVDLSGTGAEAGLIKVSPGLLDFGQVAIGKTSDLLTVAVENASDVPVPLTSVSAEAPFSVAANACDSTLAPNTACAVSIAFTPTREGAATGTLSVVADAGIQTILLKGMGAAAATDTLSATSLVFSSTAVGQESTPQIVSVSNTGDLPLNSITTVASAGFRSSDICGGSIGAHTACSISVVFAPGTVGPVDGTLTVSDSMRSQTVNLSGTALAAPALKVSSTQIDFGTVSLGQISSQLTLTISNSGGVPIMNAGFRISGQAASSFSWNQSTCGAILQTEDSCSLKLTFAPLQTGQLTATLVISSSTIGVSPVQVALSGLGQGSSKIQVSPVQLNFLQPKLGEATAAQFATISNTGNVTASELVVTASTPFNLTQSTCGSDLSSGESCSVGVEFTPSTNGLVRGTLSVTSKTFADPAVAALQGIGGAAGSVQVQPGSLTFPTAGVGTTSAPQTVTITNNGPVALSDLTLDASAPFRTLSSSCAIPLNVSDSCTVQIAFAPVSAGQQAGKFSVVSSSLATPAQVAISGMGFDFQIGTIGQSSKTVASGQAGTYTLTLTPLNGSAGTFTFSCSSLPANSACNFNPASAAVPANATWSVSLTISTGLSSSTASLNVAKKPRSYVLPLACLIVFPIAFAFRRRSQWALVMMLGLIGIVSCAGAGGGAGGTPVSSNKNTPAGTYSIVVTANANGISHNTTITLVVD